MRCPGLAAVRVAGKPVQASALGPLIDEGGRFNVQRGWVFDGRARRLSGWPERSSRAVVQGPCAVTSDRLVLGKACALECDLPRLALTSGFGEACARIRVVNACLVRPFIGHYRCYLNGVVVELRLGVVAGAATRMPSPAGRRQPRGRRCLVGFIVRYIIRYMYCPCC